MEISPGHLFSAGKDAKGVELVYAPTRKTVINASKVDSLRSVFLDNRGHGTVRYAPIANSSDGVGGALNGDKPGWYGFGHEGLPEAEIGFAIASPVLRMKEGTRKVTVTLTLNNVASLFDSLNQNSMALAVVFEVFITGEKKWLGPYDAKPTLTRNDQTTPATYGLTFYFNVPESEKGVIDYSAEIHGCNYTARAPIIQVMLKKTNPKPNSNIGYNNFKNVTVKEAAVKVDVSNITSLNLESDAGVLDPKKAFLPFGPQPTVGSRFMVGYAEALSKNFRK